MAKMPAACNKAEPGPKPGSWGFEFFLSNTSTCGTCSPNKAPVVGSYSTSSLDAIAVPVVVVRSYGQ